MSTTPTGHHNETGITVDPVLPTIVITREFEAPPERVFRAHTDPDLVVQWLGPRSLSMEIERYEARTGGSYRYVNYPSLKRRACTAGATGCGAGLASCSALGFRGWVWGG